MHLTSLTDGLAVLLMFSALVSWRSVSSLDCYRCGLTREKLKLGDDIKGKWPDTATARSIGMVECGEPAEMKEFVTNCHSAKKCHTIRWADGEFQPIRFCFPVDQSCDSFLEKLKGKPTCHECYEKECNNKP